MTNPQLSSALVVLDQELDSLTAPSREVLTVARGLAKNVTALVLHGAENTLDADNLARYGAQQVLLPEIAEPADLLNAAIANEVALAAVRAVNPDVVLLSGGHLETEVAAFLAVKLDSGVISGASALSWEDSGDLVAEKSVLSGSWVTRARVRRGVPIITLFPAAYTAQPVAAPAPPETQLLPVELSPLARSARVVARAHSGKTGLALPEAGVVVCVGRGVAGELAPARELTEVLGGALGATRDVTDEGWLDRTRQIGQTGVNISPDIYLGLGVSGAVHHTSGMRAARNIAAINTDPDAPIFEIADLGVVGDLHQVVPALVAELRARGLGGEAAN